MTDAKVDSTGKKKILIVEDEFIIAEDIKYALLEYGYEIPAVVGTGEQAIEEVEIHEPDLVLMDIFLRGEMDGIEAAKQIHSRFNIPIVYLTASRDADLLERVKTSEPHAFIIKPYKDGELHSNIEIVLYKHQMEKRLIESETRYRNISELTSDYIYEILVNPKGKMVLEWISEGFTKLSGYTFDDVKYVDTWGNMIHADDFPGLMQMFETILSGQPGDRELRLITKSGQVLWINLFGQPKWDDQHNHIIGIVGAAGEITARKQAEESVRASEEKFAKAFFSSPALMAITKIDDGRIVDVNHTYVNVLGYTREELIGRTTVELNLWVKQEERQRFIETLEKHKEVHNIEVETRQKSGNICHTLFSGVPIHLNGEPHLLSIAIDITERKKLEEQLHVAAITDVLTGLYNRRGFFTLAEQQCKLADRTKRNMSLLFLDLDDLKAINDRFGHQAGDEALVDTANIIKNIFRKSDIFARIGGDEFVVLLTEHDSENIETIVKENLKQKFIKYNEHTRQPYHLSLSMGMAHYDPQHPCSIDDLLRKADAAMYKNKRDSKSIKPVEKLNRRTQQRFEIQNYWTKLDESDTCEIKNISPRGICLKAPQKPAANTIYSIRMSPFIDGVTPFEGIVVWSSLVDEKDSKRENGPYYEVGLKFIKLNDRQEDSINQFINRLSH